jgi:hypothetical protein
MKDDVDDDDDDDFIFERKLLVKYMIQYNIKENGKYGK